MEGIIVHEDFIRSLKTTLHTLGILDGLNSDSGLLSSNPTYTILFHSFLKSSVMLDCEWRVKVTPKAWALAFLQVKLENIAATLGQFVFNAEELFNRNFSQGQGSVKEATSRLPYHKVNAIINASIWLMNKTRDPWSYVPPREEFNFKISEEELGQIERGLLKFETVFENGPFLLDSLFQDDSDHDRSNSNMSLKTKLCANLPSVLKKLCVRGEQLPIEEDLSLHDQIFGTIEGLILLRQADTLSQQLFPENQHQIKTNVDLLRAFTLKQFSNRDDFTDSFFDAMQVSESSLNVLERRRDRGFGNCVRSLFRMQYIRYRGNKSDDPQIEGPHFTGILQDSFAAVLILSSIRCVAWLEKNFSPEEKFDRKKLQHYNPNDVVFPDSSTLTEIFQLLQDSCKHANFDIISALRAFEPQPQVQMEVDILEANVSFEQSNNPKTRLQDISNNNYTSNNPIVPSASVAVPASVSSGSQSFITMLTSIRNDLAENEAEREDNREYVKAKFICDTLERTLSIVLMDFINVEFSIKLVSEAFLSLQTATGRKDPEFEAGKVLFIGLFTPYEIFHGSLNGRKREGTGAKTLGFFTSPELKTRSHALLEMIRFLSSISNRLSVSDLLMPKQKLMRVHAKQTQNLETLKRKIFVEYRKQRAKDMTPFIKSNVVITI